MGVERIGTGWIDRRQQPHVAQAFDGAPPLLLGEVSERVGQARNRRLATQRLQTIAARGPVEQADAMEDGEQDRLTGEPFLFIQFHHPPRVTVQRIVGVAKQARI